MKLLILTLYPPTAASARYRVHQFLPALRAAGIACTVACAVGEGPSPRAPWRQHLGEWLRRKKQLQKVYDYDAVFIQKGLTSARIRGVLAGLAGMGERLVYDIDDAVHLAPPDRLPRVLRWLEDEAPQAQTLMREARLTLAGNAWLASECTRLGGRPRLFPTVVDTQHLTPQPQPDNVYRLGWMGSPSTAPALESIAAALRGETVLSVGSGNVPLSFRPTREAWSLEAERSQLARMSVGLMPLAKDEWSLGKCALKALQYMAMGRPVIATPWGAAAEVVAHGETGFLADSMEQWREAIDQLRDPALRARMGAAARARVEERYSLKLWAPKMVQTILEMA